MAARRIRGFHARARVGVKLNSQPRTNRRAIAGAQKAGIVHSQNYHDAVSDDPFVDRAHRHLPERSFRVRLPTSGERLKARGAGTQVDPMTIACLPPRGSLNALRRRRADARLSREDQIDAFESGQRDGEVYAFVTRRETV